MTDMEIESQLEDAGYQFNILTGTYQVESGNEEEVWETQAVSNELEIPLDDLYRWEQEQRQADATAPD